MVYMCDEDVLKEEAGKQLKYRMWLVSGLDVRRPVEVFMWNDGVISVTLAEAPNNKHLAGNLLSGRSLSVAEITQRALTVRETNR